MKRRALAAAIAAVSVSSLPLPGLVTPAAAQMTVFDPSNYAQNLLTASRALQQVTNQIRSLQNEATMLQNMATELQHLNFSSLTQMTSSLQQISTLMNQAAGIASFNPTTTGAAFTTTFPTAYGAGISTSQLTANAQARWTNAITAYRQTMQVQSQVVSNVQADSALLATLVNQSQGAVGGLQAQQAANQLTALAAKQQFQIQSMMAAQYRANAVDQASQAQAQAAARAATLQFLGSGVAYSPQ
ncbi:MAG: P-type conjugative transfer protein TrbJ [Caulobacteraceae bacterium]|nr:P-type conjugative transfer protein TrbJ [Caulobacteraceae bacterium]